MKKIWGIVGTLFLIFETANALPADFFISFKKTDGYTYEQLGEYLFSSYDNNLKVSYLEWQHPAFYTLGFTGEAGWKDIHLKGNFNYLFPLGTGYMHDLDWAYDLQTNFAYFDNYGSQNFNWNVELSYDFKIKKFLSVAPVAQFEYAFDSFSAENGYGYFGNQDYSKNGTNVAWDSEYAMQAKCSDITYARSANYIFLGANAKFYLKNLTLNLQALITPYSYVVSRDYHSDANDTGYDYTMIAFTNCFFNVFKIGFSASYQLENNVHLYADFLTLFSPEIHGKLVTNYLYKRTVVSTGIWENPTEYLLSSQPSGISIFRMNVNLGIEFKF